MLARIARVVPCWALLALVSSARVTTNSFFAESSATDTNGCTVRSSFPFGPSTRTRRSWIVTLAAPTGTGFFPILLIRSSISRNGAQQFAADVLLAGLAVAHDAFAGADDGDAHAVEDV